MDDFFLRHDVYKDRDPDELVGKVNSDSDASDEEESLPASVHDPYGPWQEKNVSKQGNRRQFKKSTFTGPKGVLSDYKAYKKAKALERAQEEAHRQGVLTRIAKGYVEQPGMNVEASPLNNVHDSDDDLLDEFDDEAILQSYCAKRVAEIKSAVHNGAPEFGTLSYCSAFDFVDIVDHADSRTCVIVHMSDENNYMCTAVNKCLETLAVNHSTTRFLVVQRQEADDTIHVADLPIFMVYRGSVHVDTILNVPGKTQGQINLKQLELLLSEFL